MDRQTGSLRKFRFNVKSYVIMFATAFVIVFALTLLTPHAMQAQTFSVIHYFTGVSDGGNPTAGVTIAPSGTLTLYGTTSLAGTGGNDANGTVFKLTPHGSGWVLNPLYEFTNGSDGGGPLAGVVIRPNGALYGTTSHGGAGADLGGTGFELTPPPASFCRAIQCYWNERTLYSFSGLYGATPNYGNLILDQAGNIYGATYAGGAYDAGAVYELTPSGGGWTESILHSFNLNGTDGVSPLGGVIFDTAGNLYGTTETGGTGVGCPGTCGTVYQLTPSGGSWLENIIYNFGNGASGYHPEDTLTIDPEGNLYGTTSTGGNGNMGTVFKLANASWSFSLVYSFTGCAPFAGLTMDGAGNLYGACYGGGQGEKPYGWIFKLPANCNDACTPVDLHDFSVSDGEFPQGTPVLDASGNLYGTTFTGGHLSPNCYEHSGCGVVWKIAGVGARH